MKFDLFNSILNLFLKHGKEKNGPESDTEHMHRRHLLSEGTWVFQKAITDGDEFEIDGLNIWDYKWHDTGQRIHIKDPMYSQDYTFNVWEINKENFKVIFAAGEFSNLIWGIYLNE